MGRNTGKRHSTQDQKDTGLKTSKEHSSTGGSSRATGGNSQTERERNSGKEGGARRGESKRTGSESNER
ncbi:MAG TPA: hypothetical protein VD996_04170 [Chitinophagaceae bacterium]|nr:hypothetical protein [Chitinophagaceae bacterium]